MTHETLATGVTLASNNKQRKTRLHAYTRHQNESNKKAAWTRVFYVTPMICTFIIHLCPASIKIKFFGHMPEV